MKVNQSSKECAEFNSKNAELISLGLAEALEPTAEVLAAEKKELEKEQARRNTQQRAAEILVALGALPESIKFEYQATALATFKDVTVSIEKLYTQGSGYSSYFSCWRAVLKGGENNKWVKLGGSSDFPTCDPKTLEKIRAKLLEVQDAADTKKERENVQVKIAQRKAAFLADPANKVIVWAFSLTEYYCPASSHNNYRSSGVDWKVLEDGNICISYTTRTREQWLALAEMKKRHKEEYQALAESLKTA